MRGPRTRLRSVPAAALLAALVLLIPMPGGADVIDEIASRYAGTARISGNFRQVLTSGNDPREWVYAGRYHYNPTEGLVWEVDSPVKGSLRIDRNGNAQASGELGGLSMLTRRTVGRLVVAMVSLDREVLERYYALTQRRDTDDFEIILEAHDNWKRQAGRVTIRGDRLVESVRMSFPDGRRMALELTHDS